MAKVTLNHAFESMSGKLCRKGSTYVALNKQTGKMYTAEYHAREVTNSEALQQVKATFTKRAKFASLWWNANKPSTTNAAGTANYQLVIKAYKGSTQGGQSIFLPPFARIARTQSNAWRPRHYGKHYIWWWQHRQQPQRKARRL